ncbi:mitochondrial 37s ribosomal protein 16 [Diplodia corticola]|uniref:Mitochondrial 37s ribosomal protein 16 n=1 Tax=Diplodia corticola TaxID=236234 RepID=A0A1J9RF58_9PEZI|nr:mitochondrial 37s ribosomal protein 16 [Diplodia corticola]OJD31195.1 mitochondrial 37s ribosomal protein 16 [Diplodia corticola]
MLYELIGIVRPGRVHEVKEYAAAASTQPAPPVARTAMASLPLPPIRKHLSLTPERRTRYRIAKTAGSIILNSGGVVRGVTNWGVFQLPKPFRKHQVTHYAGHHFLLRFDASPRSQHALRRTMGLDPRLIRYSVVKLGDTLDDIVDVPGVAPWGSGDAASSSKVSANPPNGMAGGYPDKFGAMMAVPRGEEERAEENFSEIMGLLNQDKK